MLQLKRFTAADGEQAYTFLQAFAPDENGFMNPLPRLSERSVFNAGAAADSGARRRKNAEGKLRAGNLVLSVG